MKPVSRLQHCRLIAVFSLILLAGASCRQSEIAPAAEPDSPVILIVNKESIQRSAWETFSALRLGDLKPETLSSSVQSQMLDDFIVKRILAQEATQRGLALNPAELPPKAPPTPEDGAKSVAAADRERERASDALIQKLQKTLAGNVTPPTREDVRRYYEEHSAEFQRDGFYAREIRVESRAVIQELARQLNAGSASFAELARKYSRGPNASQGGLSYYERGQLPAELEEKALALRPGETSAILKTSYGFHIFKLERLAKSLSFDSVQEEILEDMVHHRRQELVAAETKRILSAAHIELFPSALGFEYVGSFHHLEK